MLFGNSEQVKDYLEDKRNIPGFDGDCSIFYSHLLNGDL